MQYNQSMAYSIRLSEEGEKAVDEIIEMGNFPNRAEAVRTALNLLWTVLHDAQKGRSFVSLPDEKVDEMGVARSWRSPAIR